MTPLDREALEGSRCPGGHWVDRMLPDTLKPYDGRWYCAACWRENEALAMARRRRRG